MQASIQKRLIPEMAYPVLKDKGVREGDAFTLDLFQERKKNLTLNRAKYIFELGESYEFDSLSAKIILPRFSNQKGSFELILIHSTFGDIKNREDSRYLLKSLDLIPFKINGVFSFESFIERGDILEIGYNRIFFPKKMISENLGNLPSINVLKSLIPICIEGETGTGKTTMAKRIHDESGRVGRFVHLNLSSFSLGLLESEIFGHIKGAFTGAINSKRGALAEAHRGTLFLDEIDSLSLELQTKLLIFLDNYEFRAVGSEVVQKADLRLIIASGQDLKGLVDQSKMRKDFYFRIKSGVSLKIHSLKEDPKQIKVFCDEFEKEHYVVIDKKLVEFYEGCSFPGNFRQLKSHLQKKKIYADGKKLIYDQLDEELLVGNLQHLKEISNQTFSPLENIKVEYCYNVFLKLDSNLLRTAKILELSPNTLKSYLNKKTKKLGFD